MKAALKSPVFSIRPATAADAPLIRALAQRIWPVCYADALTPEQIANMLERIYSLDALREQMHEEQRFWIAQSEHGPAGYASAYKEDGIIWLKKLYCDPAGQGQGIGTALMETAIAALLPAAEVRLLTNRDNTPAQTYYERKGFTRIGELPVMMGDFSFVDYMYSKTLLEKR